MSETKHTPGELEVRPCPNNAIEWEVIKPDGDDDPWFIAVCMDGVEGKGNARANAARIALTWNCHDELVAALKEMVRWYGTRNGKLGNDELLPADQQDPEVAQAMAILAKAATPTP